MVAIIKPYREIELNNQTKFAGYVHIKKVDRSGRVTFETKYKNLLTDYFIQNGFGGVPTVQQTRSSRITGVSILLGTGVQTEPQPNDTALNNFLEARGTVFYLDRGDNSLVVLGATPADDYLSLSGEVTFDYALANGALTEIGLAASVGSSSNSGNFPTHPDHRLLAKSLIKDSNGNPVVVNKTDAEQLIVSYEIRVYRPNEAEATFNIGGTETTAKILSYGRSNGAATDIDTDQTGRGVYPGDSLCPEVSLNWVNSSALRGGGTSGVDDLLLPMLALCKDATAATRAAMRSHNLSLPGNIYEGHIRLNPTTASRDIYAIRCPARGFLHGNGPNEPSASLTARTSADNRKDELVFINPTTRARTTLTLPANYRMDIGFSFERGRK